MQNDGSKLGLFAGTGNKGNLLRWNGSNAWIQAIPQYQKQSAIRCLAVFNNKLYGGTAKGENFLSGMGTMLGFKEQVY